MPSRLQPSLLPSHTFSPDKITWDARLWAAVIRRAAADWIIYKDNHGDKGYKLALEAERWLFGPSDPGMFNSFVAVCGYLGLSPATVRAKILELTEDDVKKRRAMEFGDE